MNKTLLILSTLFPLVLGCKKDEEAAPLTTVNFGPGQGIFYRDSVNQVLGIGDPTDWRHDFTWQQREKDLFSFPVAVNLDQDTSGTGKRISLYPNPVKPGGSATLDLSSTKAGKIKLVWVDKDYKVLRQDTATVGKRLVMQPSFPQNLFAAGQTYRLYYVLYQPSGRLIYKGHGDVQIR